MSIFNKKKKPTASDTVAIRVAKELGLYEKTKNLKNAQPVTPRGRKIMEEWREFSKRYR